MTATQLRTALAERIIFYNFILLMTIIVYFVMRGFDRGEFTVLLGSLGPVTALYVGSLFKYIARNRQEQILQISAGKRPSYFNIVAYKWIIFLHFVFVFSLFSAKALFHFILFEDLTLIFAFVESTFVGFIGYLIASLLN